MREPGEVGERLKLNSMCGVNLAAHALMNVGQSIRHIHGNADEPQVRNPSTLLQAVEHAEVGQPLALKVVRGQKEMQLSIRPAALPAKGSAG